MAPDFNESEVIAWMRERAASTGIAGLEIKFTTDSAVTPVLVRVDGDYGFGETINDAVENLMPRLRSRTERAKEKRLQAQLLIAEADALDATVVPPLVIAEREGRGA